MKLAAAKPLLILGCGFALLSTTAVAGPEAFQPGPVFKAFGHIAKVDNQLPIPKQMKFKVVFDTSNAAKPGEVNRHLDSLARFINMHVAAGVKREDIEVALVVHGKAATDLVNNPKYVEINKGAVNGNLPLVKALTEQGVQLYVCGQTAAYFDIQNSDLLPGVKMALSAMTAHAILAQQGYSLNPF
ncbi:DsrE family protein [Shewanella sp. Isolate11]|uniref:DsrE family protein n=1 Tax=Shewanella sp. Isolate11 TaxID=2908530 RepID=UPI001EFDC4EB|nr:DsrE family protein [Shewanella sp. Isolate11]MCG9695855.1 DsrE family protein [Shewanella sp. Isolate11]